MRVALAVAIPPLGFILASMTVRVFHDGTPLLIGVWVVTLTFLGFGFVTSGKRASIVAVGGIVATPLVALAVVAPGLLLSLLWSIRLVLAVIVLVGLLVAILLRPLLQRRRHRRWRPIRFRARLLLPLATLGAVPGAVWGVVLTVDESPRRFPVLEATLAPARGQEESTRLFAQLTDMADADDTVRELRWQAEKGSSALPDGWAGKARNAMDAHQDALKAAQALLSLKSVNVPPDKSLDSFMDARRERGVGWAGDLLLVRSRLLQEQGRLGDALDAALATVRLGVAAAGAGGNTFLYFAGVACVQRGFARVRAVAASDGVTEDLLRPIIGSLDLAADLDAATVKALGSEYNYVRLLLHSTEHMQGLEDDTDRRLVRLIRLMVRRVPMLKPNLTLNVFGGYLEDAVEGIGTYRPRRPVRELFGPGVAGSDGLGVTYHTANPVGDIMVMMESSAVEHLLVGHFRLLATARLTQVFIALRCYQLEHGKLPNSLDVLAPDYLKSIPVDPFTGKPFGYEAAGPQPCIRSVGPDGSAGKSREEGGDDIMVPLRSL